jgi:hypothetical protein
MTFQSLHQNLNQIAQICNQLSQSEQANVSRLQQMQQTERISSQQLQQCIQLCHQVSQQMQQMSGSQLSGIGQNSTYSATGAGLGGYNNWTNIPINTSNAFTAAQGASYSNMEAAKELTQTPQQTFNTNKDAGQ